MKKEILTRLFYSFLFSLGLSILIFLFAFGIHEGFEANQARALLALVVIFILLTCLVLSATAFLNLLPKVRANLVLSLASFIALPLALLCYILVQNGPDSDTSLLLIINSPCLLYIIALIYHFFAFRKTIDKA